MLSYQKKYNENIILQTAAKFLVDFIMIICATYIIISFTCDKTSITGSSMNTVLTNGDTVLLNKMRYAFSSPERFDIVAFQQPNITSSKTYIKRIIGLPGETIQIIDGKIYINGNPLENDISSDKIMTAGLAANPITLDTNEFFVLGDNRNNSEDSRFANIGTVKKENIIGAPWLVMAPLSNFKFIR